MQEEESNSAAWGIPASELEVDRKEIRDSMSIEQFSSVDQVHAHALKTLTALQQYDTFMESIDTLAVLGCGKEGLDLEWWATRTTRDEEDPLPLNIKCTGIDVVDKCKVSKKYDNVVYRKHEYFEKDQPVNDEFDVVWAHNVFHRSVDPLRTLGHWWRMTAPGGMLAMVVPHYTNFEFNKVAFEQPSYSYFNHTMVSLIYMLAVNGWDCASGFFKKVPGDPWISAVVYKSSQEPRDPRTTSWYDLVDAKLLPQTADKSIKKHGFLVQQDLVLLWLDKNLTWLGHE